MIFSWTGRGAVWGKGSRSAAAALRARATFSARQIAEGAGEAPLDLALGVLVVRHLERDLLAGLDVDVDEGARDPEVPEALPEVAVAEELAAIPLEGVSGRPDAVDRKVGGLELFDQPVTGLTLDAAVEAAREDGRPVLDRDPGLEVDLAAVGRVGVLSLAEDAGVDLGAETQPPPTVAAIEPDATEPLVLRELANGDLEGPGFFVKAQAVDYNLRVTRAARWFNRCGGCSRRASSSPLPDSSRCLRPARKRAPVPARARRRQSRRTSRAPSLLRSALDQAALRPPTRKDGVSIAVADLETGESIFEKNAGAPETIASVTKMISTAAALHYLGPSYKFRTTFWRRGEIRDGNLLGSLLVVGGGDPNISGRFYDDDVVRDFRQVGRGFAAGRNPASHGRSGAERELVRRGVPPP